MQNRRTKIRQLFKAGSGASGPYGNVVLNFTGSPKSELALIGVAYHRAARLIVDDFGKSGYSDLDAYPIVFLYRHALELLTKAVLTIGAVLVGLLDDPALIIDDLYRDHSLLRHLPQVKRVFEAVGWTDAFEQMGMAKGEFEEIVAEFEKFDASSFTFRYPIKKDGNASLAETHFTFSPRHFAETLDPILNALSGACTGLEEYRRLAGEVKAQIASDAYEAYIGDYYDPGDLDPY